MSCSHALTLSLHLFLCSTRLMRQLPLLDSIGRGVASLWVYLCLECVNLFRFCASHESLFSWISLHRVELFYLQLFISFCRNLSSVLMLHLFVCRKQINNQTLTKDLGDTLELCFMLCLFWVKCVGASCAPTLIVPTPH